MHIGTMSEFILIAILALILIGPRDLPKVMRWLGQAWNRLQLFSIQARHFLFALSQESDQPPKSPRIRSLPPKKIEKK